MRTMKLAMFVALGLLAGCNKQAPEGAQLAEAAEGAPAAKIANSTIKVALPQIAYTSHYSFELPAAAISTVQQRHVAACDRLGPARCHVLDMQSATQDGKATGGTLKLVVEAGLARRFAATLAKAVSDGGGKQSDSRIEAEDLSKQIVDIEARLRAKQVLAGRLMELLETRRGPVADLVEAERQVSAVQEEIDAAQSWLAEARGRVAMSTFELSYETDGAIGGGFWDPLKSSLSTMGGFFGQSLAALITLIAFLLPWALVGGAIFALWRYVRRRRGGE